MLLSPAFLRSRKGTHRPADQTTCAKCFLLRRDTRTITPASRPPSISSTPVVENLMPAHNVPNHHSKNRIETTSNALHLPTASPSSHHHTHPRQLPLHASAWRRPHPPLRLKPIKIVPCSRNSNWERQGPHLSSLFCYLLLHRSAGRRCNTQASIEKKQLDLQVDTNRVQSRDHLVNLLPIP